MTARVEAPTLNEWLSQTLLHTGLDSLGAQSLAEQMVTADLLGRSSHGSALLPTYLGSIESGSISKTSTWTLVNDRDGSILIDLHHSVGAVGLLELQTLLVEKAKNSGIAMGAIRNASHIGALQVHLLPYIERDLVVLVSATNPAYRSMAHPEGKRPVTTSNPIAFGAPGSSKPILVDISATTQSNSYFQALHARGLRAPGPWLKDSEGRTTDEPSVLLEEPPGTVLPIGAPDLAYKGFAVSLFAEIFALALSGGGRTNVHAPDSESVFVMVIDPEAVGGLAFLHDEIDALLETTRESGAVGDHEPRLPGERALQMRKEQNALGIELPVNVIRELEAVGERFQNPFPTLASTMQTR